MYGTLSTFTLANLSKIVLYGKQYPTVPLYKRIIQLFANICRKEFFLRCDKMVIVFLNVRTKPLLTGATTPWQQSLSCLENIDKLNMHCILEFKVKFYWIPVLNCCQKRYSTCFLEYNIFHEVYKNNLFRYPFSLHICKLTLIPGHTNALKANNFELINFGQNIFGCLFMEFRNIVQKFWRTKNYTLSAYSCLFHTENVKYLQIVLQFKGFLVRNFHK